MIRNLTDPRGVLGSMHRIRRLVLLPAIVLAVAACADVSPPTPTPRTSAAQPPTASPTPLVEVVPMSIMPSLDPSSMVGQAIAAWQTAAIDDYTWQLRFACECGYPGPLQVTVVDGNVTQVTGPTGAIALTDVEGLPLTVDRLLASASDAVRGGGSVKATWGPDGVPSQISIDFDPHTIDDELDVTVSRFRPAP